MLHVIKKTQIDTGGVELGKYFASMEFGCFFLLSLKLRLVSFNVKPSAMPTMLILAAQEVTYVSFFSIDT